MLHLLLAFACFGVPGLLAVLLFGGGGHHHHHRTTTAAGSHAMTDRVLMVLATLLSGVAIAALDLLWQAAP